MDLIFNELSTSFIAPDKKTANAWMLSFFELADVVAKRIHKRIYICSTQQLKNVIISNNYTFQEWLHTLEDKDYLRKIVGLLTNRPLLDKYPYYYYNQVQCEGLRIAHEDNSLSISYPSDNWGHEINIIKEFFDEDGEVKIVELIVKNIASISDINFFYPVRIFEHHAKHDNKRPNLHDGESTLLYDIPSQHRHVQKFLDIAFGDKRLYSWDSSRTMFLEFNRHIDNRYHGYHIEDANRVPNHIKIKIDEFNAIV